MILAKQREAFSMIMALVVIVLMATVAALIFNMTGKIIKNTTTQYQKEQAVLLAKSYTELAIMSVMANDRNNTYSTGNQCLENINGSDVAPNYRVRTRISYIGNDLTGICSNTRILNDTNITTPESELNIIVDVYVEYKEYDHPTNPQWIKYHRRSLQKI